MSSPAENSSSRPSTPSDDLFDYPIHLDELVQLLDNREGRERLQAAFDGDTTGDIILRMFMSITNQVDSLDRYVSGLRTERNSIYNFGMRNPRFNRTVTQLIRLHRERRGQPYLLTPPTPYQPTNSTSSDDPSPHSSPRSVVIHPEEADATRENPNESTTTIFHTADENELGTQSNPIDVDQFLEEARQYHQRRRLDTPHPIVGILQRRIVSAPDLAYCTICTRQGHLASHCIHRGLIICDYCKEAGHHLTKDCPEWRRDAMRYDPRLQFCLVCSETGHTVERCAALRYAQ
jgi:hypothetical protein